MVNSGSAARRLSPLTGPKGDVHLPPLRSIGPEINPINYDHPLPTHGKSSRKTRSGSPSFLIYLMVVEVMLGGGSEGEIKEKTSESLRYEELRQAERGRKCTPPRRGPHSEPGEEGSNGGKGGVLLGRWTGKGKFWPVVRVGARQQRAASSKAKSGSGTEVKEGVSGVPPPARTPHALTRVSTAAERLSGRRVASPSRVFLGAVRCSFFLPSPAPPGRRLMGPFLR